MFSIILQCLYNRSKHSEEEYVICFKKKQPAVHPLFITMTYTFNR